MKKDRSNDASSLLIAATLLLAPAAALASGSSPTMSSAPLAQRERQQVARTGQLPVPNFAAGGVATPADAAAARALIAAPAEIEASLPAASHSVATMIQRWFVIGPSLRQRRKVWPAGLLDPWICA